MSDEAAPLAHIFRDEKAVKQSFMPFVRDGGIFIPTDIPHKLGEVLSVKITLPGGVQFSINGEVIWVTPKNSPQNSPGIGLQCAGSEGDAFQKAVRELIGDDKSETSTETM